MEIAIRVPLGALVRFWERLQLPWKPVRLVTTAHLAQVPVVLIFVKRAITVKQALRNRNYVILDPRVLLKVGCPHGSLIKNIGRNRWTPL